MNDSRTWVLVLSLRHALACVTGGYLSTGTGKAAVLRRMSVGDRVVIYSPRTDHPGGEPLRAATAIGEVTGADTLEAEPGLFRRTANLSVIEPVPLTDLREHLPVPLLRYGCIALTAERAGPLWRVVRRQFEVPAPSSPG